MHGTNSYSGGTTVSDGWLLGTTASIQGNIVNNANVYFFTNSSGTYAGIMSGTGSLTAYGTASIALTAANTYTGPTTISRGGLQLNGSIAGSLSVESMASLSGTGTIGGNATIAGTHSPGNSPGTQTFNGNLTYSPGAIVNWELIANTTGTAGVNYDQIIMPSGNLTFSGSTTLALSFNLPGSTVDWSDAFWNVNQAWTIYDLSGGATSGISNLLVGGSLLDAQGDALSPTGRGYFTTSLSGQDVMLNFIAVPEPSGWVMAGIGCALSGLMIGRRRSR
jgi:autotransporter-associated beta strand protein